SDPRPTAVRFAGGRAKPWLLPHSLRPARSSIIPTNRRLPPAIQFSMGIYWQASKRACELHALETTSTVIYSLEVRCLWHFSRNFPPRQLPIVCGVSKSFLE